MKPSDILRVPLAIYDVVAPSFLVPGTWHRHMGRVSVHGYKFERSLAGWIASCHAEPKPLQYELFWGLGPTKREAVDALNQNIRNRYPTRSELFTPETLH